MKDYFKSSLSLHDTSYTLFKWQLRAKIKVTMTDGASHPEHSKPIIISLANVETVCNYAYFKYEENPSKLNLRNYLIVRIPRKIGLRTAEIKTVTIEGINFESRVLMVLDSKKHAYTPLPVDMLTLHFIRELVKPRKRGYVFIREGCTWKTVRHDLPLTNMQIWNIVKRLAEECGVFGFNPRSLRRAFAYEWYKQIENKDSRKNWKGLQTMMRHSDIKITEDYVDKMFSFEDLQKQFDDAGCGFQKPRQELKRID